MNRSTIGALVQELTELGLAFESEPDPTRQVGRPSPIVKSDPRVVAFAANPEVDAITVGVVGLGGEVLKSIRYETEEPPTVREYVGISSAIIAGLRGEFEAVGSVLGIGAAVPGLVRASDGLVRWAPHLDWRDEPVAQLLAEATDLRVVAGNNATVGASAEHVFGAGRGVSNLVYLNGGASGIGGAIIANGASIGGAGGYAGEFGHVRVDSSAGDGDVEVGSLESEVDRAELMDALGLVVADADAFDRALAASTDPLVRTIVHRQLGYLSTALRNAVNVLNPEVIVLGGFLASLYDFDPELLVENVRRQSLEPSFDGVSITTATLRSDLLVIGAAELAFAALLADPSGVVSAAAS
ncbi:MAG: ROK family protein [Rhodoglobus sp.]